ATARCFPEQLPEMTATSQSEQDKPVTFWNSYINGMTYGLVFGLSIVFGFAILHLRGNSIEEAKRTSLAQVSFVEEMERKLPNFLEQEKFDVTFLPVDDSEMMSFVEFDTDMKFLDDSEEENL
ncbi:MAG: hypothetical protein ACD_39C01182G0001, partial [uncultured bacterium]